MHMGGTNWKGYFGKMIALMPVNLVFLLIKLTKIDNFGYSISDVI